MMIRQVRPREAVDLFGSSQRRRTRHGRLARTGGARRQQAPSQDLPRMAPRALHPSHIRVLSGQEL